MGNDLSEQFLAGEQQSEAPIQIEETGYKNYPQMLEFMDSHLRSLSAYEEQLIGEITERHNRLLVCRAKADRLTTVKNALLSYLDLVRPGAASETNG